MSLKAILDSLEGISDEIKKEYIEKNGKFHLDVTSVAGFALEDVNGLKTALSKERGSVESLNIKLKGFDGLDSNAARDAIRKVDEMKDWKPTQKVEEQIKAAQRDLISKHDIVVAEKDKHTNSLTKQLEGTLVTAAATKAIADLKGSIPLLLPHIKSQTRMKQTESGTFVAQVIDAEGNVRIGDAQGNPMTIPALVKELSENDDFASAFAGNGASGSGAKGGGSPGGSGPSGGVKTVSRLDQVAINDNIDKIASGDVVVVD